jgi:uncharacterized protein (DUF302 family)
MMMKLMQAFMPAKKMIDMFTVKVISDQSIAKIADRVQQECENHKFSLLQTYNYYEILEEKGFPIKRKVFVYDICQARTASLMLADNPGFSIFMPCTLAIYEDEGKTVVSTMNMEILLKAVKSNRELYTEATGLFHSLKSLLHALSETV